MTQKYTKMPLHVATWVHIHAAYENKLASPTIAESTSWRMLEGDLKKDPNDETCETRRHAIWDMSNDETCQLFSSTFSKACWEMSLDRIS